MIITKEQTFFFLSWGDALKIWNTSRIWESYCCKGHANLCIFPILVYMLQFFSFSFFFFGQHPAAYRILVPQPRIKPATPVWKFGVFPSPGDLPNSRIESRSLALQVQILYCLITKWGSSLLSPMYLFIQSFLPF